MKLGCGGKGEDGKGEDGKNWKIESLVDSIRIGRTSWEKISVKEKGERGEETRQWRKT